MTSRPTIARTRRETARAREVLLATLLFCLTLIAYWPALAGGLLWDDDRHVTLPALRSLHGLWRIWFDLGATPQYYPLLHSVFWIEHGLWGDSTVGYHLVNVVLHVTAALLLVALLRKLGLEAAAWLAGFIFALHPIAVEAVAWISEQKSTLSAVFYLGSALTYICFDQTRKRSRYFVALALFVMALFSKSVTATLPAALLLILWWQRGEIAWNRDVIPLLPWFAIGAPRGLFTAWVERTYIGAQGPDYALTWLDRTLLAGRVIWFYLSKLIFPVDLMFFYPHWTIDAALWWQYLFTLPEYSPIASPAFPGWRGSNRGRSQPHLFFIGTLFPVLGFSQRLPVRLFLRSRPLCLPRQPGESSSRLRGCGREKPCRSRPILVAQCWPSSPGARPATNRTGKPSTPKPWQRNPAVLDLPITTSGNYLAGPARPHRRSYRPLRGRREAQPQLRNPTTISAAPTPGSTDARSHRRIRGRAQRPARFPAGPEQPRQRPPEDAGPRRRSHSGSPGGSDPATRFADAHNNLGAALESQDAFRTPSPNSGSPCDSTRSPRPMTIWGTRSVAPDGKPEAIAELASAAQRRPDTARFRLDLGNALLDVPGRAPDAAAQFRIATQLQPDSFDATSCWDSHYCRSPAATARPYPKCGPP